MDFLEGNSQGINVSNSVVCSEATSCSLLLGPGVREGPW